VAWDTLFGCWVVYPAVGGGSIGGKYITVLFNGSGGEGKTHAYYRAISGKVYLNRERQSRCPLETVLGVPYVCNSQLDAMYFSI